MIASLTSALVITFFAAALFVWRMRTYRNLLNYEPARGYDTLVSGTQSEMTEVPRTKDGFSLPPCANGAGSCFLELTVESTLFGRLVDPKVILESDDFKYEQ